MAIPESAKLAEKKDGSSPDKSNLKTASIKDVLGSTETAGKIEEKSKKKADVKAEEKVEEVKPEATEPTPAVVEKPVKEPIEEPVKPEPAKVEAKPEAKKGRGCLLPKPKCSCQSCTCFGCLLIIILFVLCGSVLYFRPPFVWNMIKSYLNAGYKPPTYTTVSTDAIDKRVQKDLSQGKDATLTEQELQSLAAKLLKVNDVRVDVEPNYMRIVTDADNNNDHPLWLMVEIGQQADGNLKITKIGFNRFGAPSFLRNAISDSAFKALNLSTTGGSNNSKSNSNELMSSMVDANGNGFSITSVRFDKDKVTIKGKVTK